MLVPLLAHYVEHLQVLGCAVLQALRFTRREGGAGGRDALLETALVHSLPRKSDIVNSDEISLI